MLWTPCLITLPYGFWTLNPGNESLQFQILREDLQHLSQSLIFESLRTTTVVVFQYHILFIALEFNFWTFFTYLEQRFFSTLWNLLTPVNQNFLMSPRKGPDTIHLWWLQNSTSDKKGLDISINYCLWMCLLY